MNHSSKKIKNALVVPFYNERRFLPLLIERIPGIIDKIICVDDGSTDGSSELPCLADNKIILLRNNFNKGKGFSLKVGFEKCFELNAENVITLDADLQHPPELIPEFITALSDHDIVIGVRNFSSEKMPPDRVFSNTFTSFLLSIKSGLSIKDSQSGYRAFRSECLRKILPDSDGFIAESEMLILAGKYKFLLGTVKIPTIYGEERSKIKKLDVILKFVKLMFRRF